MDLQRECPVCGAHAITTFLRRPQTLVHQHLFADSARAAAQAARGDLTLGGCEACGFIFNQTFEAWRLNYGPAYDNAQTCSSTFRAHLDELINDLLFEKNVQHCRIVEVGCGQGLFLRKLIEAPLAGNTGHGFDPSYSGPEVDLGGRLVFEKRYYTAECANIPADVVICRHVIEHVPEPVALLRAIRQALVHSPRARVFIETPCVEWIFRHSAAWDFFYEHCSYFTADSLTTACERAGFNVESVRNVFDGQYLWLEATPALDYMAAGTRPGHIPRLAVQLASIEEKLRQSWQTQLRALAATQKIALWGAGAKGVTLANLLDPERELICCLVDLNPNKQGRHIPGSGHRVVAYTALEGLGVSTVVLMNPNYRHEVLALLKETHAQVDLISLGDR